MDKTVGTYLCECGKDFHSTWVFDNHRIKCIALAETLERIPVAQYTIYSMGSRSEYYNADGTEV